MADMNITPARANLTPVIWDSKFFTEYVRKNKFVRYMGTGMNDMIQVREDLTRKVGDTIVFPAVRRLVGAGVTGNQLLEGNEELLNARSMRLPIGVFRHGVAVSEWDEQKSAIDLRDAARDALLVWELEKMKTDILLGLTSHHRERLGRHPLRVRDHRPARHLADQQQRPHPLRRGQVQPGRPPTRRRC